MGHPNLFKIGATFGRLTGLFQVEQGRAWYRCKCRQLIDKETIQRITDRLKK